MNANKFTADYTANCFLSVCEYAYVKPPNKIVVMVADDEEVAFHIMHKVFLDKSWERDKFGLEESYPFVKLEGKWFLSIPKLYVYLFRARKVLAMSDHPAMKTVYMAVQRASRYYDEWKALDEKLTPKRFENYEEYTEMQQRLYVDYCADQLDIFATHGCQ